MARHRVLVAPDVAAHEREVEEEHDEAHDEAQGGPEEQVEHEDSAQSALHERRVLAALVGALPGEARERLGGQRVALRHVLEHVALDRLAVQLVLGVALHLRAVLRAAVGLAECRLQLTNTVYSYSNTTLIIFVFFVLIENITIKLINYA